MIKFFRRIRQKLLSEDNFSKYLFYAIGEIILVVIGILIALSINNWNEYREERLVEKELLNELLATAKTNQRNVQGGLDRWQSTTGALDLIIDIIDNQLPYADSLAYYFEEAHRKRGNNLNSLDFSGYKALENRGFNIIRNKNLRRLIILLFEQRLKGLEASNIQLDIDNSGFHYEYIARNFKLVGNKEIPNNFQKTMKDPYYYSILNSLKKSMVRKIYRVDRFLEQNQLLLEVLEAELAAID